MGWVQGAGTPVGMVAEMLAAGLNANCGGRDHIALDVERQIALLDGAGLRLSAGRPGLFVTGASHGQFPRRCWSRANARAGPRVCGSTACNAPASSSCAYASREAHGCVRQAMEMSGLGARHPAPHSVGRAARHARRRPAPRHRRRPRGGASRLSCRRHGRHGGHRRHRRSRRAGRRRRERRALVPRRRRLRRAGRAVAGARSRWSRGWSAPTVDRLRFPQMGPCALRRRLLAGARPRGAPARPSPPTPPICRARRAAWPPARPGPAISARTCRAAFAR